MVHSVQAGGTVEALHAPLDYGCLRNVHVFQVVGVQALFHDLLHKRTHSVQKDVVEEFEVAAVEDARKTIEVLRYCADAHVGCVCTKIVAYVYWNHLVNNNAVVVFENEVKHEDGDINLLVCRNVWLFTIEKTPEEFDFVRKLDTHSLLAKEDVVEVKIIHGVQSSSATLGVAAAGELIFGVPCMVEAPLKKTKKARKAPAAKTRKSARCKTSNSEKENIKKAEGNRSVAADVVAVDANFPNSVTFREITPVEMKKLSRIDKENTSIYKIHDMLLEQEKVLCQPAPSASNGKAQPAFLTTKLLGFQLDGVGWMREREASFTSGGILADEMGMGKTLQMLGLILSGNVEEMTLIVVPTVALSQWMSEIQKHTTNVNLVVSYGRTKVVSYKSLVKEGMFNVFLTTYGTLENSFRNKKSILDQIDFYRIVLDEAHLIKDSRSSTSRAISRLGCAKRWGMTGTPVQNRLDDLYSLVKFLRIDPHSYYFCKKCECKSLYWLNYHLKSKEDRRSFCTCGHFGASHFSWWNRKITNQIQNFGYTTRGKEVFDDLKKITSHIILRRTKENTNLGLPLKTVTVLQNHFSEEEKDFYTSLYSNVQGKFMAYATKGEVLNNYAHIFELLQKMRLATNHPYLVNKQEGPPMCGFCNEEADDPIVSKCKHIFCREEARVFLATDPNCPVCKVRITIDLNQTNDFSYRANWIDSWRSSTKIECLVERLSQRTKTELVKSIVFSQFVNFLEMLRWRLERAGFRAVCIYGSMPMAQRRAAIEAFNTNKNITVFLISLKAGGVALNLTEATQVFIMDLWWNPAVEEQAMDRIHRIGQHRPIKVFKIIIEDSIESKVLALQKKKKALFDSAVENDINALKRLTEDDLMFLFT